MDFEAIVLTYSIMVVPGLYWLGLHFLLPGGKHSKLGFLILSFVFLVVVLWYSLTKSISTPVILSTAFPVLTFQLYGFLRKQFIKRHKRPPEDVALNFQSGIAKDRIFALTVTIGFIFGGAFVFLLIHKYIL